MKTPAKKRTAAELAAAVLWCALTLGTDRLFFRYDWRTPAFFVYKALFLVLACLLYTSPSPRDPKTSRMPSSA